ncbi:MAG: hypothetical protein WEC84_00100 [Candidatus Andersenbacteria bacterium]
MVNKLKRVAANFQHDGETANLFALLKMDEYVDKWTIVIVASWFTEENRDQEFNKLLMLLKKNLDPEELYSIGRVAILDNNDHLAVELLKRKSGSQIENERINGNEVHEGFVVKSLMVNQ